MQIDVCGESEEYVDFERVPEWNEVLAEDECDEEEDHPHPLNQMIRNQADQH